MRHLLLGLSFALAGCCSAPAPSAPARATRTVAAKPAVATVSSASVAAKDRYSDLVSVYADDADLRDVVGSIALQAGVNIVVEPNVHEKVTLTLRNIGWMEALQLVAQMTRCEINVLRGGVYYVIDPPKVTLRTD